MTLIGITEFRRQFMGRRVCRADSGGGGRFYRAESGGGGRFYRRGVT